MTVLLSLQCSFLHDGHRMIVEVLCWLGCALFLLRTTFLEQLHAETSCRAILKVDNIRVGIDLIDSNRRIRPNYDELKIIEAGGCFPYFRMSFKGIEPGPLIFQFRLLTCVTVGPMAFPSTRTSTRLRSREMRKTTSAARKHNSCTDDWSIVIVGQECSLSDQLAMIWRRD